MRKRFLFLAASLALVPIRSRADVPVIDVAGDLQLLKDYEQSLKSWILQNTQALSEANTDIQTAKIYLQEVETYIAFVRAPSLGAAMGLLNQAGLTNDLPVDPMVMAQIAAGFSSMSVSSGRASLSQAFGLLNVLGQLTSSSYATNHVYTCPNEDQICIDMNARASGIAGSMGTAQAAYTDLQTHQHSYQALRDQMVGETDPAKRETIIAQLQIESVYIQNLGGLMNASMAQANLQQKSFEQRELERQRQSADALFADSQPLTAPFQ